ncbi:hypothetical protein SDC9_179774 [bioreactor metagenome]|uniref:Uncharacterized protein n=1 Tax=bioreactor metagenome TaxID=1076179 RepID=A0A645H1D3_9ZZZZ
MDEFGSAAGQKKPPKGGFFIGKSGFLGQKVWQRRKNTNPQKNPNRSNPLIFGLYVKDSCKKGVKFPKTCLIADLSYFNCPSHRLI